MQPSTAPAKLAYNPELLNLWKIQPSRREGYHRSFITETPEGDELEVDFNNAREMVQITLTVAAENGRQYAATIKSGTIIRERDVTSARAVDLTARFYPFRKYFGFLREEPVLRAIGGNYDIPEKPIPMEIPRFHQAPRLDFRELGWLAKIKRYLEKRRAQESVPRPWHERLIRRLPAELADIGIGGLLLFGYFQNWYDIAQFAGLTAFLGILSGALDWVWRQRNPFLPKVMLLLGAGGVAVWTEVQYRMWSIFL